MELVQNDVTNHALGVTLTSRPTDILDNSTPHTDVNTAGWVGVAQTFQYQLTLNTDAVAGLTEGGLLEVYVNLALPNTDVNVDPAVTIT